MNHYGPRQRSKDNRWDYVCTRDERTWPVGYCAGWKELTPEEAKDRYGKIFAVGFLSDQEKRKAFLAKYHVSGHETEAEACQCYRTFLLDQRVDLEGEIVGSQRKCLVCGDWTQKFAQVDMGSPLFLCVPHLNLEEVDKVFGPLMEILSSY